MDPHRAERVAEALRAELEELINFELEDPRIGSVAVTEVLVAPDARKAQVRVRLEGSPDEQREAISALERARHFLRHQLAERLQLFKTPDLHFEADLAPDLGLKASHLLKRIRKGRPKG
jgi:ribosome-binding factor A